MIPRGWWLARHVWRTGCRGSKPNVQPPQKGRRHACRTFWSISLDAFSRQLTSALGAWRCGGALGVLSGGSVDPNQLKVILLPTLLAGIDISR
ncbi:hypothetical protein LX36DRAFT_438243 [Colletotrichum falcatum]|nr:hypothetical protein LX36DRAFT_438243 [Colletotrichum falcatum]